MRISDWNSDVCSSDLTRPPLPLDRPFERLDHPILGLRAADPFLHARMADHRLAIGGGKTRQRDRVGDEAGGDGREHDVGRRSEEHTSELQSLMRISYAVFCLKKKKETKQSETTY